MLITQEQLPVLELSSMNKMREQEIEIIKELHALANDKNAQGVFEYLDKLIQHTAKHFSDEEQLMKEAQYPDYYVHQHEHAKQLLDLQAIRSFYEMTTDTQSVSSYLEGSLTPWITEHVQNMDSHASQFLKEVH